MISDINKLELDVKWQNLTPGCTIVGSCTAEVFRTEERLSQAIECVPDVVQLSL